MVEQAVYRSDPAPYQSRYPCGSLVHDGVWYYGTYCLAGGQVTKKDGITYNWPWIGPFVGFCWSTDFGKTWTQTPCTPAKPLFSEHSPKGEPIKIGAPHFVDFGKNMQHSPDGKAYLVAHGASDGKDRRFGYNSWITGDENLSVLTGKRSGFRTPATSPPHGTGRKSRRTRPTAAMRGVCWRSSFANLGRTKNSHDEGEN